ncbi:MAG TPA: hypothetical protein VF485_11815 [Sphingomonas sp.]
MKKAAMLVPILTLVTAGCERPASTDANNSTAIRDATPSATSSAPPIPSSTLSEGLDAPDICTSGATWDALKKLISAAIIKGAQRGWPESSSLMALKALAAAQRVRVAAPAISFSQTIVDGTDTATGQIQCTASALVDGREDTPVYPRISFVVQKTVENGQPIVSLVKPLQVEDIASDVATAIRRQLTSPSKLQARDMDADQPEAANPGSSANND